MKKMILGSFVATLIAGMAVADTVTSVNVVGYYNLTVGGDASAVKYTLLSTPMTRMPVDRGLVSANTGTTITSSGAGWTASAFAPPADYKTGNEPQEETFFIEITSGAFEGKYYYIADNTADTLTLAAADADLGTGSNPLAGASYKIVPAVRIQDVFGAPGSTTLVGGGLPSSADNILIWNGSGWYDAVFYKNTGPAPTQGWKQGTAFADDMPIDRDEGLMVKRMPGNGDATLTVAGEVSGNVQSVAVDSGYTLQNGMVSVDTLISDTGLEAVMQGGGLPSSADNILEWDPDTGGWKDAVFYKNTGPLPTQGWKRGTDNVGSTFMLKAGQGYLFKVQTPIVWDRNSPIQ